MKLDKTKIGPDEPIRIDGDFTDAVSVDLDGVPLRIDQIQEGYIIAWSPLERDYVRGDGVLTVRDEKVEEVETIRMTDPVVVEPVEAVESSFVKLTSIKNAYQLDWKAREGSEGMELTLQDDRGHRKTIVMKTSGDIGKGSLGKRVDAEQRLTIETKTGLRVKDRTTKLDDVALTGEGWKVVGIREL